LIEDRTGKKEKWQELAEKREGGAEAPRVS
jgi:hypothetical protein